MMQMHLLRFLNVQISPRQRSFARECRSQHAGHWYGCERFAIPVGPNGAAKKNLALFLIPKRNQLGDVAY